MKENVFESNNFNAFCATIFCPARQQDVEVDLSASDEDNPFSPYSTIYRLNVTRSALFIKSIMLNVGGIVYLFNVGSEAITVKHNDKNEPPEYRIYTMTGLDYLLSKPEPDSAASFVILISQNVLLSDNKMQEYGNFCYWS